MKKNEVKKLRLSRETLQLLISSEVQKVVGGSFSFDTGSCGTGKPACRPEGLC
jgi:hypothetical protein